MNRLDDTVCSVPYQGHTLYVTFERHSWAWTAYLPGGGLAKNPALSLAIRQATRQWIGAGRPNVERDDDFPTTPVTPVTEADVLGWAAEEEHNRMHALFSGETEGFVKLKKRLVEPKGLRLHEADRISTNRDQRSVASVIFGNLSEFGFAHLAIYVDGTFEVWFSNVPDHVSAIPRLEAYERCLAFIREYELTQRRPA